MKRQVFVIIAWFIMISDGGNFNGLVYTNCDGTTIHCIECLQLEMQWGRYYTVPNQIFFKHLLQFTINEYRSKYAEMFGIGNMRYGEWNKLLYDVCHDLTSEVGDTKFNCITSGGTSPKIPTRFDHDLADFDSSVDTKVSQNNTAIFEEQFKILLNKVFEMESITEYNMDEFGCEFSLQAQRDGATFLLRCMFYTNPDYANEGVIHSTVPCSNCSTAEFCSNEHAWLCVKQRLHLNEILNTI